MLASLKMRPYDVVLMPTWWEYIRPGVLWWLLVVVLFAPICGEGGGGGLGVIRNLSRLLLVVLHGTEALVYSNYPREPATSTCVTIISVLIAGGVPWFIRSTAVPGGKSARHAQNSLSGEWSKTLSTTHHALSPRPHVIICTSLAPAVTVGERRELWILPPFFFGLFFCL